jgi:hypothetical protein
MAAARVDIRPRLVRTLDRHPARTVCLEESEPGVIAGSWRPPMGAHRAAATTSVSLGRALLRSSLDHRNSFCPVFPPVPTWITTRRNHQGMPPAFPGLDDGTALATGGPFGGGKATGGASGDGASTGAVAGGGKGSGGSPTGGTSMTTSTAAAVTGGTSAGGTGTTIMSGGTGTTGGRCTSGSRRALHGLVRTPTDLIPTRPSETWPQR